MLGGPFHIYFIIEKITNQNVHGHFLTVFENISEVHSSLGITLTQPRTVNRQIHRPNIPANNPKDYYRISTYIPIIEHIIEDTEFRFNEDFFSTFQLKNLETLHYVKSNDDEINNLCSFLRPFVDPDMLFQRLKAETDLWMISNKEISPDSTIEFLFDKCDKNKEFFPLLYKLFLLLLSLPASVASCERSFSALKRLKAWTRSNMAQERLSGLALMHINRDIVIDTEKVIDRFAEQKNRLVDFIL